MSRGSPRRASAADKDPKTERVAISLLKIAESPRIDGENPDHVHALAEVEGAMPPIVVHRASMRVVDGMHRVQAASMRGAETIEVTYVDGTERDLFVLSVELNTQHGLPLSRADRLAAAAKVVGTHPQWSDGRIAEVTGLSAKTVATIRRRSTQDSSRLNARIGRDGKARPLSAAHGRRLAGQLMAERPNASLREIAREAGVSLGTAQDVRKRLRHGGDPASARGNKELTRHDMDGDLDIAADSLRRLKSDPAMRYSEFGRALIRLFAFNRSSTADWARLADFVPNHCASDVVILARGCADSLMRFSEQVERRVEPSDG